MNQESHKLKALDKYKDFDTFFILWKKYLSILTHPLSQVMLSTSLWGGKNKDHYQYFKIK